MNAVSQFYFANTLGKMVSALLIFFTVTSNICDMQLCYERERYSYISYEINEVIQRSSLNQQCVINSTFMEVIAFDQEQLCDMQIEDDQCYAQPVEETTKEWTAKEGAAKEGTAKEWAAKKGTAKEGTAKKETAKEETAKEEKLSKDDGALALILLLFLGILCSR
ncbi:uncharacterized protein LOC128856372 [Anastrepha ludens]|uniref:uncharacterized protein LOC128856372 n=1 Tax=Anastrepha ludens TaxID=28586 RepID=UPI0023AF6BA1|nr:uncharacterized protein LOC128856372 [Anastrepha ludens]